MFISIFQVESEEYDTSLLHQMFFIIFKKDQYILCCSSISVKKETLYCRKTTPGPKSTIPPLIACLQASKPTDYIVAKVGRDKISHMDLFSLGPRQMLTDHVS